MLEQNSLQLYAQVLAWSVVYTDSGEHAQWQCRAMPYQFCVRTCRCLLASAMLHVAGTVHIYIYIYIYLYAVAIGPVTGHDFHSYRSGSMIRVKLRQFSIKVAKKVPTKNHNIALNGIRTRNALLRSPEHYQLSTNATNPTPLVLSI